MRAHRRERMEFGSAPTTEEPQDAQDRRDVGGNALAGICDHLSAFFGALLHAVARLGEMRQQEA